MKNYFLAVMAVAALLLTGCVQSDKTTDYKAKGESLAKQLIELCDKQDTAAVLELERSIRAQEEAIVAAGDSATIADFRNALKEAREKCAPYITTVKIQNGVSKDDAIQDVVNDALEGNVDIDAVSSAVDAALKEQNEKKQAEKK